MAETLIGDSRLICGDARKIAGTLGISDRGKCVIADIPYKLTQGTRHTGRTAMKGGAARALKPDGRMFEHNLTWREAAAICKAVAAEQSDLYLMANDKHIVECINEATRAGFRFHNLLVWDKVNATPNRWYMKHIEFIAYMFRGHARQIGNPSSKQGVRMQQIDESVHPTEKPVALMMEYIRNSTGPGDMVIDPVMGSGTTGVAAARLGRRFIGIEIDQAYYEIAVKRISEARSQIGLFAAGGAGQVQTEMFIANGGGG